MIKECKPMSQKITEQDLMDYRTNFRFEYPNDPNYDTHVYLERINLDDERIRDMNSGKGMIISHRQKLKGDVEKNPNSIFSPQFFGKNLGDISNPLESDYKCQCGYVSGHLFNGTICPKCRTKVRKVEAAFDKYGWIVLHNYYLIHPNLYRALESFLGAKVLNDICMPTIDLDKNGMTLVKEKMIKAVKKSGKKKLIKETKASQENPFSGIGMIEFYNRFDEIMSYYYAKSSKQKKELYNSIMADRDKVFTHSVPVYSLQLRPYEISDNKFALEGANKYFNMMATHAIFINKQDTAYQNNKKLKSHLLYKMQTCWNEIYCLTERRLSGKKGDIRECMSYRSNFSVRNIMTPAINLEMDEIRLPYAACVELLRLQIIAILKKSYNYSYSQAYYEWYKAKLVPNERMKSLMMDIIKDSKYGGLPILFNRNPTIAYGSILFMKVVGINDHFACSVNNLILPLIAGDYDGDTINIYYLMNHDIIMRSMINLDPINAMVLSKNDGMFNNDVNLPTEALITMNSFRRLSPSYTKEEEENIEFLKSLRPKEEYA